MSKQYRIHLKGTQREQIDADLMAQLVVMFGRQLAEDARQAAEANRAGDNDTEPAETEESAQCDAEHNGDRGDTQ